MAKHYKNPDNEGTMNCQNIMDYTLNECNLRRTESITPLLESQISQSYP
jgi:hypothetical protein